MQSLIVGSFWNDIKKNFSNLEINETDDLFKAYLDKPTPNELYTIINKILNKEYETDKEIEENLIAIELASFDNIEFPFKFSSSKIIYSFIILSKLGLDKTLIISYIKSIFPEVSWYFFKRSFKIILESTEEDKEFNILFSGPSFNWEDYILISVFSEYYKKYIFENKISGKFIDNSYASQYCDKDKELWDKYNKFHEQDYSALIRKRFDKNI